jgi:hypothetical protein
MNAWNWPAALATHEIDGGTWLLAARTPAESSGGVSATLIGLAVAAGTILALVTLASLGCRWFHQWHHNSPAGLFYGLCRLHGLPRSGRQLLKQVALAQGLAVPARVFTEPQWLERGAALGVFAARAAELAALRDRFFGADDGLPSAEDE